jgi:hypothetical protein
MSTLRHRVAAHSRHDDVRVNARYQSDVIKNSADDIFVDSATLKACAA